MREKETLPYPFTWHDTPIDLSFVFKDEKPAGKRGFLTVQGERFVFEDGTPARFWGTNFNSGANFPSHEHSEKVAKRLAKFGVNMVRFHQMDAEWSTPNIFQFTKGERKDHTRCLDPESLDRLDYLIYCLKQEGIYMYMDLLVYRKFKSGDGVENASQLTEAAKPYSNFSRKLIELQKQYNEQLFTHYNPYTKLAYKDDPSIVMTDITNENDLFLHESRPVVLEPYRSELEGMYREWADRKRMDVPAGEKVNFACKPDETMTAFLSEVQTSYYVEMIDHLRAIGVKIPIAGTNWPLNAALLQCQTPTDFTDNHAYWWLGDQSSIDNRPMTAYKSNMLPMIGFMKLPDKPMFISEWESPWPNEWRAETPLLLAAAGAFQGWSGYAIHTYRYTTSHQDDRIGRNIALNGITYRGIFDTFNDPAKFGLFYHAALILRRGDVKEGEQRIKVKLPELNSTGPDDSISFFMCRVPATDLLAERHKYAIELPGPRTAKNGEDDIVIPIDTELVDAGKGEVLSDTGEMYRSWVKRYGWINAPRTKAVYGFIGQAGLIELSGMSIEAETDFATIAISSLTDDPLASSDNMLLTAIGRADNTEAVYNEDHTAELKPGRPPVLVEVIRAKIRLKTEQSDVRVWSVNPEGFFTGAVPSEWKDGVLSFEIGHTYPSMYYLIQKN
ncbi:hypothetical protein [Paenibacillus contaminans]|uniref:Glycoside hydrolase family 42 N-terminal domain-containing protein n=1 Tax=Paenibacillus contaminans TaxID=450362 RepID=A0A329MFV1_9BACL|nr:hypothetical protein [Paenibacillus contaminans]RAV18799.1 hypothetical protein DQG23_24015 [Paenibacillus contaminans]